LLPDIFILVKQGVDLTGRNRTGPPWSVGRPTADALAGRPARPPATLQTPTDDDDRQQTPASKTILVHYKDMEWKQDRIFYTIQYICLTD